MDESGKILARDAGRTFESAACWIWRGDFFDSRGGAAGHRASQAARQFCSGAQFARDLRERGPPSLQKRFTRCLPRNFLNRRFRFAPISISRWQRRASGPAIVLLAGTGSFAVGRNAAGEMARAGGYGSQIGDEGSAYDIGRRAVLDGDA